MRVQGAVRSADSRSRARHRGASRGYLAWTRPCERVESFQPLALIALPPRFELSGKNGAAVHYRNCFATRLQRGAEPQGLKDTGRLGRKIIPANNQPAQAPASCAAMKPGTSTGRIPENVSVNERATEMAGFAKLVDATAQ
jgi:hypothetical protein